MNSHRYQKHSRTRRLLSLLPNRIVRRIFPSRIPPVSVNGPSGSRTTHHIDTSNTLYVHRVSCDKPLVTIDILPDDVLLLVFHFVRVIDVDLTRYPNYRGGKNAVLRPLSWWHPIVHVCRNWRSVVFASPNFLDVRLVYYPTTGVELMDMWPHLPIIIRNKALSRLPPDYDFDAVIAYRNRVCEIKLDITSSQFQRLASVMQDQFPALIHLKLKLLGHLTPALPDGLLDGSAHRLQTLRLESITFPALPKLLLSATDLVRLELFHIPHSGYTSPDAIVTALAVLTNLKILTIEFESPLSRPDPEGRRPPSPTCIVLRSLTSFTFKGVSEYLEDLVVGIDAPFLNFILINFFHQPIFDIPQLAQFMRRATGLKPPMEARVHLDSVGVWVKFLSQTGTFDEGFVLGISCTVIKRQLLSLAQLRASFSPSIYMVEHLYISPTHVLPPHWQDDIENVQWMRFLRPFTAVKNLYVSKEFVQCIAPALQERAGGRETNVLPALENLLLGMSQQHSRPVWRAVEQFVAARQLLGHPVAVSHWKGT